MTEPFDKCLLRIGHTEVCVSFDTAVQVLKLLAADTPRLYDSDYFKDENGKAQSRKILKPFSNYTAPQIKLISQGEYLAATLAGDEKEK